MNQFLAGIYADAALSAKERAMLVGLHSRQEVSKGKNLIKSGALTDEYWVIETGLLRSFVVGPGGNDITTNFYSPGSVALEFSGFFLRKHTQEALEVVSDSVLWRVSRSDFEAFMKGSGAFGQWGRHWMVNYLVGRQQFHLTMLTDPARARYEKLVKERPEVIQASPLKHIATYLGITDSTLSRLRKNL